MQVKITTDDHHEFYQHLMCEVIDNFVDELLVPALVETEFESKELRAELNHLLEEFGFET